MCMWLRVMCANVFVCEGTHVEVRGHQGSVLTLFKAGSVWSIAALHTPGQLTNEGIYTRLRAS